MSRQSVALSAITALAWIALAIQVGHAAQVHGVHRSTSRGSIRFGPGHSLTMRDIQRLL
jgi:hypothetical protein